MNFLFYVILYLFLNKRKEMRIYLIGFMGCGKTTLGKELALLLNYTFIDLDELIEESLNMPVKEIFSTKGEDKFRILEKECLHHTVTKNDIVIATGGGAPCFFDNMDFINLHGNSVYLKMDPFDLRNRLTDNSESTQSQNERPLIKNKPPEQLLSYIQDTLVNREQFYSRAKLIVDGTTITASKLKDLIIHH